MAPLQLMPWLDEADLRHVAALFFPAIDLAEDDAIKSKERGVAIVTNWKHRIPYNHALKPFTYIQATSDLTAATLSHSHHRTSCHQQQQQPSAMMTFAIRASYSQAISRFVTTICDKENSGMHKAARLIDLPPYLVDLRHAIVHRLEPSLIELEAAAKDCLEWLRGVFWDGLMSVAADSDEANQEISFDRHVQWMTELIEFYYSNRKTEIKAGIQQTSEIALETRARLLAVLSQSLGSAKQHDSLLRTFLVTLLDSRRFWPKEINKHTMAAAIMMWDPLLLALSIGNRSYPSILLQIFIDELVKPTRVVCSEDPKKIGLFHWISYLLQQGDPNQTLSGSLSSRRIEATVAVDGQPWSDILSEQDRISVLDRCIIEPGPWTNQLRDLIVSTLPTHRQKDYQDLAAITAPAALGEETEPESLQAATERIMRMAALDQDSDAQSSVIASGHTNSTTLMAVEPTAIPSALSIASKSAAETRRRGWRLQTTAVIPRPIGVCRSAALEALLKVGSVPNI